MAVDKLTPRVLSTDKDQRITTATEFVDANNIRVTVDGQGNGGVIKNLKSDVPVTLGDSLPAGTNTVINAYGFDLINKVFVLISNSEGNHSIWYYDLKDTVAYQLMVEPALGFRADDYYYIDGVMYGNSPFLYMTNGRSEPIKINVNAAIAGTWPSGTNTAEKMIEMAVAKAQPNAPSAVFETHDDTGGHGLLGDSFQFAAQFVYRDGEESALSHYSPLYVSPNTLNETVGSHTWDMLYNSLVVSVDPSTSAVDKVRLYYRRDSLSPFYFVEEKDHTGSVLTFDFHNDKAYTILPDEIGNKMFDAVPKTASAQTYAGGRIVYGNYTEGFSVDAQSAVITPIYYDEATLENLPADVVSSFVSNRAVVRVNVDDIPVSGGDVQFVLDATIPKSAVSFTSHTEPYTMTFNDGTAPVSGNLIPKFNTANTSISMYADIPAYTSMSQFASSLSSIIVGQQFEIPVFTDTNYSAIGYLSFLYRLYFAGSSTWEITDVSFVPAASGAPFSGDDVIEIKFKLVSATLVTHKIINQGLGEVFNAQVTSSVDNSMDYALTGTTANGLTEVVCYISDSNGSSTFKSGESHSFGVVFEDNYGRQSGVQEFGSVYVEWAGAAARNGKNGRVAIQIDPTSIAPPWASKFFFVYGGGDNYNNYTQYAATEAAAYTDGSPKILVSLRGLQGTDRSYTEAKGALINYAYSKGDKLRVVSYVDTDGNTVYPVNLEFDIVNSITTTTPSELPATLSGGTTADQNERAVGQWLVVDARDVVGFSYSAVAGGTDFWANECVVELANTNKSTAGITTYYACSPTYNRSQYTSVFTITDGNSWYKPRMIIGFPWTSLYTAANTAAMSTYVKFVEAEEYTDYDSNARYYNRGKVSGVIYNEKEQIQLASVTWSDQLNTDSPSLTISSFNNTLANWFDFEMSQGNIQGLANKSAFLVVMQKDGIAIAKANTVYIQNAADAISAISDSFLADYSYFDTKLGLQYRGSFVSAEGSVFGIDVLRGAMWSVGNQGITVVSENGMSKYFADYCAEIIEHDDRGTDDFIELQASGVGVVNLQLGYDRRNKEIIVNRVDLTSTILPSSLPETVYGWNKDYSNKSIVYNVKENVFVSFRDLVADGFVSMNNRFFAIRQFGSSFIHEQEVGTDYQKLLGVLKVPSFTIISVADPSTVKKYNAISIEGDAVASVSFSTKSQSSSIDFSRFSKKEESFYAGMPRAAGSSEYVTIGRVNSVSGNDVTFFNSINRIPFKMGGSIYKLVSGEFVGLGSTSLSLISSNVLSVSSSSGISANDTIAVKSDSGIDGDQLSGHYLEIAMTFVNPTDPTGPIEVYAVNLEYSESNLHHTSEQ